MTAARAKPAVYDPAQQRRRALTARWHMLAKERGLDEETRRDRLERSTGKRSAADCSDAELAKAIGELAGKPAQPARLADAPHARKARALWLSLHQLGVVREPGEAALRAFARRQLGTELSWSDAAQGWRLIEALKAMADRGGWRQDLAGVARGHEVRILKRRLAEAIGVKLDAAGIVVELPGYAAPEGQLDRWIDAAARRLREAAP